MRASRKQRNSRTAEQRMRDSRADSSSAVRLFCCFVDFRRRAGFTLTETLIAIAIVVVVAAIAWPNLLGYAREQTLRESAYRITRELDAQRNEAERRGVAIAVFVEVPARGTGAVASVVAQRLEPSDLGVVFAGRDGAMPDETDDMSGPMPNSMPGSMPSGISDDERSAERRLLELSRQLTVRQPGELARDPEPIEQRSRPGGMMLMADPEAGMLDAEPTDRRWLIAVYLPDGTVVPGTGLELTLGRLGPVRVAVEAGLGRARATEPARDPMLDAASNGPDAEGLPPGAPGPDASPSNGINAAGGPR